MKHLLYLLICIFICFQSFPQSKKQDDFIKLEHKGDCKDAIPINTLKVMGSVAPANNHGDLLEYKGNSINSIYYFQEEHHTTWYKFKAKRNAYLTLNISPDNIKDDYDFILYQYKGHKNEFCQQIKDKKLLPIRSNISRNKPSLKSQTGLSLEANKTYVGVGPGDAYSAALEVKHGDIYYLVIDNIHGNGGYQLEFRYYVDVHLNGKIINNSNKEPVQEANIQLNDVRISKEIANYETKESGKYDFNFIADVTHMRNYHLLTNKKGFFPKEVILNSKMLHAKNKMHINIALDPIEEGKKFTFEHINFVGDSDVPLRTSYPEFRKLYNIMDLNKGVSIKIEGHTNGCQGNVDAQWLSEARAAAIKKELTDRGIDPSRIETIGYGCTQMLYPNPRNWNEQKKNMRVEISVTKYDKEF